MPTVPGLSGVEAERAPEPASSWPARTLEITYCKSKEKRPQAKSVIIPLRENSNFLITSGFQTPVAAMDAWGHLTLIK